jgi:hypothetical protein
MKKITMTSWLRRREVPKNIEHVSTCISGTSEKEVPPHFEVDQWRPERVSYVRSGTRRLDQREGQRRGGRNNACRWAAFLFCFGVVVKFRVMKNRGFQNVENHAIHVKFKA